MRDAAGSTVLEPRQQQEHLADCGIGRSGRSRKHTHRYESEWAVIRSVADNPTGIDSHVMEDCMQRRTDLDRTGSLITYPPMPSARQPQK